MGKKRKTRKEKIIARLRRQLAAQKKEGFSLNNENVVSQEAISEKTISPPKINQNQKLTNNKIFSYNPILIKKDIFKTLFLTFIILIIQIVLYLKLK